MRHDKLLWCLPVLQVLAHRMVVVDDRGEDHAEPAAPSHLPVDDGGGDHAEQAVPSSFAHGHSRTSRMVVDVDDRGEDHAEQAVPSPLPLDDRGEDLAERAVPFSGAHVDAHVEELQLATDEEKWKLSPSAMLHVAVEDTASLVSAQSSASVGERLQFNWQSGYGVAALAATAVAFMALGMFLCSTGNSPRANSAANRRTRAKTREQSLDDIIRAVVQERPAPACCDAGDPRRSDVARSSDSARWTVASDAESVAPRAQPHSLWTSFISPSPGPSEDDMLASRSDEDMTRRPRAHTEPIGHVHSAKKKGCPAHRGPEGLLPLLDEFGQLARALEGPVQKYPKTGRGFLGRGLQKRYVVVLPKPRQANVGPEEIGPALELELWRRGHLGYWDSERTYTSRGRPKGSIALANIEAVRRGKQLNAVQIEHHHQNAVCILELLHVSEVAATSWVTTFQMLLDRVREG